MQKVDQHILDLFANQGLNSRMFFYLAEDVNKKVHVERVFDLSTLNGRTGKINASSYPRIFYLAIV